MISVFHSFRLGRESNLSPLQLEYDLVLSTTGEEVVDSKPLDADGCQCDLVLIRFCVPRDTNCQWQLASSKKFAESSYLFLSLCFTFVVMLFLVVCYLISRYKCTDCCYNEFWGFWPVYLHSLEVLPCITDYTITGNTLTNLLHMYKWIADGYTQYCVCSHGPYMYGVTNFKCNIIINS